MNYVRKAEVQYLYLLKNELIVYPNNLILSNLAPILFTINLLVTINFRLLTHVMLIYRIHSLIKKNHKKINLLDPKSFVDLLYF